MTTPQEKRALMIRALKTIVVPAIKRMGYTGAYPHFRKRRDSWLYFVSFQFARGIVVPYGGFVLEFGRMNKDELPEGYRKIPFEKLDVGYVSDRYRLKPKGLVDDFWFAYRDLKTEQEYDNLAQQVVSMFPIGEDFLQTGIYPN